MSKDTRKSQEPLLPPIKKIELDDKHRKVKLIVIVLLLALGVTLIAVSVSKMLSTEPGWVTITASANVQESCGGEFTFLYLLGEGEQAANFEQMAVTQLYTDAAQQAFQIFHESKLFDGVHNVAYLNQHPNEVVEIPKALYDAFALFARYQNRSLYLAPIYAEYSAMFKCETDDTAEQYDPDRSEAQNAHMDALLKFTRDENAIKLELLGNNQVKLSVSAAYLQYAAAQESVLFIDFYWMKNAFLADYLAQALIEAGYTNGAISSYDGFVRNLDTTDREYQLNLYDRVGRDVYPVGSVGYTRVKSMVSLRNYPLGTLESLFSYQWKDGSYTSCHIDVEDGRSKSAVNDLTGYSRSLSCSEVLMELYPVFVVDALDEAALQALPEKGVETVYCSDSVIHTSDAAVTVTRIYNKDGVQYSWKQ